MSARFVARLAPRCTCGAVVAAAMLVVPSAFGQPLRATVVHIEGVQDAWRVTDKDGKIVECTSPVADQHPDESGGAPRCQRHLEQVRGTVPATVVAVDTLTNRVKVQTQAGQVIELDTATTDRQIGVGHAHSSLPVPRRATSACTVREGVGPRSKGWIIADVQPTSVRAGASGGFIPLIGARGVTPRVFQWHAAVMVKPGSDNRLSTRAQR